MRSQMGVEAYNKAMSDTYNICDTSGETEDRKNEARKMATVRQQLSLRGRKLQEFSDLWALESWQHHQLLAQATEAAWDNDAFSAKSLRRQAESCLNSMIRLVNFPESPVALVMEVSRVEQCPFLTNEELEELVARCYDRRNRPATFAALTEWIRTNGHRHSKIQNHVAESKHMTACPVCMDKAKQALVFKFRSDTQSDTANYFRSLIGYMNSED
jgi:hypothetical protein